MPFYGPLTGEGLGFRVGDHAITALKKEREFSNQGFTLSLSFSGSRIFRRDS